MLSRKIASRYAEALFDLAQQKQKTAAWDGELAALASVITQTPELRELLNHPEVPLARKERVVSQAFQGKVSPEVLAVLFMLVKRGHDPDMQVLHEIFTQRWNQARRVLPVAVVSAVPLSETQLSSLNLALTKRTGASVQLHLSVDPDLIAGMVVTMGDRVIDASARTTLEQLRASMVGV